MKQLLWSCDQQAVATSTMAVERKIVIIPADLLFGAPLYGRKLWHSLSAGKRVPVCADGLPTISSAA
jgi:hypothetical protein